MSLRWEESSEFTKAMARSRGELPTGKQQLVIGLITALVVAVVIGAFHGGMYLLHKKDPEVPLYAYIAGPGIAGIFVAYLPLLVAISGGIVTIDDKGVHRKKPRGPEVQLEYWPWESIDEIAIITTPIAGSVQRVLAVRTFEGETLIGLGAPSIDNIRRQVENSGKTLVVENDAV